MEVATVAFAERGVIASPLSDVAESLGITKQAVLYHFPTKDLLVAAVVERAADRWVAELDAAVDGGGVGFDLVDSVVRAAFAVAAREPALLGVLREVARVGGPTAELLAARLRPHLERASAFLAAEVGAGRIREHDPAVLLLTAYATVVGAATETEVMRAMGLEPDVRSLVRARRELSRILRSALVPHDRVGDEGLPSWHLSVR